MMKKERVEISIQDAEKIYQIRNYHSMESNDELRFRLVSDRDKSCYIRTESATKGNWQEAHYHTQALETYIVQEGWIGLVTNHTGKISYRRYIKNEIFTVSPNITHNVYMPKGTVTHTVKHGDGQNENRIIDKGFATYTHKITEEQLIRLIENEEIQRKNNT